MINHSGCDHPSTSGARAKCRRAQANGEDPRPARKKMGSTPREIDFSKVEEKERNRGTTPRDKWMECDKCGIERIEYKGTDRVTGIVIYVGERCYWYIKDSEDRAPLD